MKNMVGSPGTWSGLVLRVLQFVCAAASLSVEAMSSAYAFKRYIAFVYLTSSMAWQLVYSLICCCLDIYALRTELDLHNPVFVWPMVITDWITGILSLAAAASSASVAIFLAIDTEFCKANPHIPCDQYSLAAILAFMAWSFMAASAASTTRLLASFF